MNSYDAKAVKWSKYVGLRCIVAEDRPLGYKGEVYVVEISPSKRRVKFRFPSESEAWEDSEGWLLIECLEATNDRDK